MRRIALALAAAALAALFADTTFAVTDVESFGPLQMELEHRQQNDFAPPLDRTGRKQQKAVDKSLALLAKPSSGFAKDAATGRKIAGVLQKAFRDEFAAGAPGKTADLPPLLDAAAVGLAGSVRDDLNRVVDGLALVPENKVGKIQKQLDKADASLSAADAATTPKKRFAKVGKAAKLAAKAQKLLDRFGDGGGGDRMTARVNGAAFVSTVAQAEYATGDFTLQIFGSRTLGDGTVETIFLAVRGVTGTGPYALTPENSMGYFETGRFPAPATTYTLVPGTGILDVQVLDTSTPHVRATFAFDAMHDVEGLVEITDGVHDVTTDVSVRGGNGF